MPGYGSWSGSRAGAAVVASLLQGRWRWVTTRAGAGQGLVVEKSPLQGQDGAAGVAVWLRQQKLGWDCCSSGPGKQRWGSSVDCGLELV